MLYVEPSALVKRYVREPGRELLEKRLRAAEHLYSSAVSFAEVHAALARKQGEGDLTTEEFRRARNDFEVDWLSVEEVAVNAETLRVVPELVRHVPLRGMDAIHLAAAVWVARTFNRRPEFVTSDSGLGRAAQEFGFTVYDPARA